MSSVQEVSWLTIEAFDNVVASFITKHKHQEKVLISHEIYNDAVKVHKVAIMFYFLYIIVL